MAIQVLRKLSELKEQAESLCLSVVPTKPARNPDGSYHNIYSKEDYVKALQAYYLRSKDTESLKTLSLMLKIDSPMLCQQFKVLKPEEQKEALDIDNNDWIAEEKLDGNRMLLMWIGGKFDAFSRNISVEDFLPVSYGDKILLDGVDLTQVHHDFIIDCEVISTNPNISTVLGKKGLVTETQLQATSAILALNCEQSLEIQREDPLMFRTFDILYLDGIWLTDKPLIERLRLHRPLLRMLQTTGLLIDKPASVRAGKRKFFEDIISKGGEGVVLKRLSAVYNTHGNRQRDGWVKVKRSMSLMAERNGLDDTLDCFITGFDLGSEKNGFAGLIGSLTFSCWLRSSDGSLHKHELARVANIPLEMRKAMTVTGLDGSPCLDSKWYGKVAAVDGATVSARAYRLQHPRLICWRPDKGMSECIIDEEFIKSQVGTSVID